MFSRKKQITIFGMAGSKGSAEFYLQKVHECAQPRQLPEQLERCAQLAADLDRRRADRMAIGLALAVFLLLQVCLAVTQYSGQGQPPMFGDFEAQRHWMELTIHLPVAQWYNYDLDYWGLDYPPLTAYHSWALGKIAERLNASWVRLDTSRGIEQVEHKLFLRLSVIVTMMALYSPALVFLARRERKFNPFLLAHSLLYPGLLFVDCAHFQYNHCSLGLFLWALAAFEAGRMATGAALFVLALNHKQMELFHALPIAVFLLARSMRKSPSSIWGSIGQSLLTLSRLALVVLVTFALCWLPFLLAGQAVTLQVLSRLFPVGRGLFEDKVANFWCCASVLVKFKQLFSMAALLKASALLVLTTSLPALACLFWRPNRANFRCALATCALSFFLFAFQVHEKSILLAAIPALLLMNEPKLRRPTGLFLSATCFSLYPLCLKDEVPEILGFFIFFHFFTVWLGRQQQEEEKEGEKKHKKKSFTRESRGDKAFDWLEHATLAAAVCLCFLQLCAHPPAHLPHLFPLLNAAFSFACFTAFWLWLNFHTVAANLAVWREVKKNNKKKAQ